MPNLPNLNSFGKLCGSSHSDDSVVLDRVKRKNSVRRMSIIEDGNVAEVLYPHSQTVHDGAAALPEP